MKLYEQNLRSRTNVLNGKDLRIVLLLSVHRSWILNEKVKNIVKICKIKSSEFFLDFEKHFENSVSFKTQIHLSGASLQSFKTNELFYVFRFLLEQWLFFHRFLPFLVNLGSLKIHEIENFKCLSSFSSKLI